MDKQNPLSRRSFLIVIAALLVSVLLWSTGPAPTAAQTSEPTFAPTDTPSPLATRTPLPAFKAPVLPAVDWSDRSLFKKAMKSNAAGDVDSYPDPNRYLIVASLSIEQDAIIRGAERVLYTNRSKTALNEIVFRLYPNAPILAGRIVINAVTVADKPVQPTLSQLDSVMTVPLPQPLDPGKAVELTVDFATIMTRNLDASYGRFGYVKDVVSATAWYPTLSVYEDGRGWWTTMPNPQGDPAYTETGLYDVRLTVPAEMMVVMSGTTIDKTTNDDGSMTFRTLSGLMRDNAFQASKRYAVRTEEVMGTRINVVYYKDQANPAVDGTENVLKFSKQAVETYNKTFGEYPFADLYIVQNPTPTGVEFPGLVQIADRAWVQGNPFLEIVIAHEIGHQWFYSLVGNNQVEHPWLDESLTSYTEFVYVRTTYDDKRGDDYIQNFQRRYATYIGSGRADQPLDLPVGSFNNAGYGIIVYTKGPLFLVELERQFDRNTVYKMLNEYFSAYKYRVATTEGIKQSFEKTTGKDLSAFFQKWVIKGS